MSIKHKQGKAPETAIDDILEFTADGFSKNQEVIITIGKVAKYDLSSGSLLCEVIGHDKKVRKIPVENSLVQGNVFKKGDPLRFVIKNGEVTKVEKAN